MAPFGNLPDEVLDKIVNEDVMLGVKQVYAPFRHTRLVAVECSNETVSTALETLIKTNIGRFPLPYCYMVHGVRQNNSVRRWTPTTFTLQGHPNLRPVYDDIRHFLKARGFECTAHRTTTTSGPVLQSGGKLGDATTISATFEKDMLPSFKRMYIRDGA